MTIEDDNTLSTVFDLAHNLDDKMIIAYSNARVREYNNRVREYLGHSQPYPEIGERLLCVHNTYLKTSNGVDIRFLNGDFLRVVSVCPKPFLMEGFYRPKGQEKTMTFQYTFLKMSLEWIYASTERIVKDIWVNVSPILSPEWDSHDQFASVGLYNGVKHRIEEQLRKEYPDFRKDRSQKKHWDELVHEKTKQSVLLHAPIVKFGYAVTGHKSQGGEWDYVWGDYAHGSNMMSEDFFRWAYTVTTRAKKHLYVAGPPHIDALAAALSEISMLMASNANQLMSTSLESIVKQGGYSIKKIDDYPFMRRVRLVSADDLVEGNLDINYKKNHIISHVEVQCPDFPEELKKQLMSSVGKPLNDLFHPANSQSDDNNPDLDIRGVHEMTVRRILDGIKFSPLRLLSAKAFTDYHVRLRFSSRHGEGELDLYFDAKGRMKHLANNTLSADDFVELKKVFGLGAESC